ncbi:MAG: ABC transporter substrate-binding protein, partial [Acidimicrobiaceae bacterium]|nr:ABC transporter substrate-binding protein [Acidimicrobiaceae bacterium]
EPEPEPEPAAPPEPIDIRLVTWGGGKFIDFIDLYVAEENGYFAEAGVTLEQLPGAGAGDAVRQVVAGNADIAMADALSGFFATIAGADLEGIYCPYTQNWMTMLVNTGAGIESPEDLRGKTVAVTSQASTSKWYAALLLADNGITEEDVTFAATGIAFGEALLGGQAQAASTWGSINWALLEAGGIPDDQVGDYEIWQYTQVPGPNDVYFANRSWVDENTDGVGRFIEALEKAKIWIQENPEAAAEIGSRYAVGADNMDRNLAVIDYRIQMQSEGPGVAENGMGWCDVTTIQDVADQATELGILPDAADASAVISNRFIN